MEGKRVRYEELKEEERINIEKQLEEHLRNNDKLKISAHAVQRMGQRGIGFKHVKKLLKTKNYFINSITKVNNNICVSIISKAPLRNKLHLKLVLCLTNYIIVTAMVKKLSKEEEGNSNEYERI